MSLFSSLAISLSGIQSSTTRLEIASSNIANASVEGYTKKTANLTSTTLGENGSGVQVSGFTRSENTALFSTLNNATTESGNLSVQNEYLQKVLDILGTSSGDEPSLSTAMTEFVNSWTALSAEPESSVSQQQVIQAADNLANEIQRLASDVEDLDRQCANDIDSTLSDLNSYLTQIQNLNSKISLLSTSRMSTGDLEDERDQVTLKIAEILDITVLDRSNGQIALYTKSGYQLVDGSSVCSFSYDNTNVVEEGNLSSSMNSVLVGGSLDALISFRTTTTPVSTDSATSVIQKLRDQLDTVAQTLTETLTTATSGEATFATAYNNAATGNGAVAAHRTITEAMSLTALTSGTTGNSLSYTLDAGTTDGTYKITITDGVTTESIDDLDIGSGPYDWSVITDAIMALPSLFVSAEVNGTGTLDPSTLTIPTTYTLYGGATATSNELASDFFTGTDRTNISVNTALLDGTSVIKTLSAGAVTDALLDSTRVFTADGLSSTGSDYTSVVTSIMSGFQQSAKNVSSLSTTSTEQTAYLQEKLANETGVNTDEEMVNLVVLQQAYTASARVMTVVTDLFDVLAATV